jgi:hypothetical protein
MAETRRTGWRPVLGTLVSAVLLAALLWWVQRQSDLAPPDLARLLGQIPWAAWATLACALTASYALRASRMHAELSRLRPVSWPVVCALALQHNAMVNLLPMRGGELAYPLLLKQKLGIPTADALASLLWMRVQDALVLMAMAVALFGPGPLWLRALAVTLAAAALALLLRAWRQRIGHLATLPQPGDRSGPVWRGLARGLGLLLSEEKHSRVGWFYCAANWGVKIAGVAAFLAWALPLPTAVAAAGALGGELAALAPLQGPAGLGTYESAVWGAVRWHMPTVPPALPVVTLAMHVWMVAQALAMGLAAWTWNQWNKNDASA